MNTLNTFRARWAVRSNMVNAIFHIPSDWALIVILYLQLVALP